MTIHSLTVKNQIPKYQLLFSARSLPQKTQAPTSANNVSALSSFMA